MSLRQLLNFVYTWACRRIPPDDLEQWIEELNSAGVSRRSPARVTTSTIEDEKAVFAAAAG